MLVFQIIKPSKLARTIARGLAYVVGTELLWNLGTMTEKAAMKSAIETTSAELFDKQGMQLADELKTKMPPNPVVMDFGCGIGRPEKFLSPSVKEIYGVDISRMMLRHARKRHKHIQNVHFVRCKGNRLSMFEDSTFDFLFSEAVFQHMDKEDVILVLMEINRVCKEGGRVYLQFPNLLCPYNLNQFIDQSKAKASELIRSPTRMRYWLPQEAEEILKALGFEIISLEVKSDYRDENRDCLTDDYHRDYSIWVYASRKSSDDVHQ